MKKKILLILLAVLVFFVVFGKRDSLSSAKLLGYDARSFEKTMNIYFKDMSNDEVRSVSSDWKKGWVGNYAPDSEILNSKEKAVTYIVSVKLDYNGELETNRMIYYFIHNKKENTLSVQGGVVDEDGTQYPMSLTEARNDLKYIFDEYN